MALNGFALGGFAQGFNQQQNFQLNQQRTDQSYELGMRGLQIQEQAQKNADQRAMMARADAARSDMLKLVSDTVTALKQNGTDNATISQKIQPIVQPLKRLTKSSGLDDSNVDAMVATMLARPATDISSITGGQSGAPQATTAPQATAAPAASSDIPNLSSANVTMGQPINAPVTPDPQVDVQRFTTALAHLPADANPNVRMAIQLRLQDAISRAHQMDPAAIAALTKPVKTGQGLIGDEQFSQFNPRTMRYEPMQPQGQGLNSGLVQNTPATTPSEIKTPMTPKASQIVEAVGMTPEAFDFNALRYAFGDTTAMQGYGYSRAGAVLRTLTKQRAAQYFIDQGIDAKTANNAIAEFQAMKTGARTIGNLEGRMTAALEKAKSTAPVVLSISDKIDRTEYPTVNSIILAAKKHTGDQNVVRLGIALETLASNYGSALGMGSSSLTDFQTKRAQELIERGYSQGQMTAAVDQMLQEMDRELAGNKRALHTFLGTGSSQNQTQAPAAGDNRTSTGIQWSIGQ